VAVDLQLEGDLEVSRKHATISKRADGVFSVTCHGANPIVVDGAREIAVKETGDVKPGERIAICSYELVLQ
jgi:predicted component of type VI protein secretion system